MLILLMAMFGCKEGSQNNDHTEAKFTEEKLPKITVFSGTEYETHKYSYAPVSSARYIHSGVVEEISPDDPRLIRLLNFIVYSHETMQDVLRQSYVYDNEISVYLSVDTPMLEVAFLSTNKAPDSPNKYIPKIIICGDKYLEFQDSRTANGGVQGNCAELYWPYGSIAIEDSSDNIELSNTWGEKGWIDIIEYAGF